MHKIENRVRVRRPSEHDVIRKDLPEMGFPDPAPTQLRTPGGARELLQEPWGTGTATVVLHHRQQHTVGVLRHTRV